MTDPRKRGPRVSLMAVGKRATPRPARPLGAVGLAHWKKVWGGDAPWLSPTADAEAVLLLSEALDDYSKLRQRLVDSSEVGLLTLEERRTTDALRDLRRQIKEAQGSLGLTPAGRAKLAVAEAIPEDPLEAFRLQGAG